MNQTAVTSPSLITGRGSWHRATTWGQERRLEFIDFRLYWERKINRGELVAHFGISIPQASLDLARYHEIAPDNLVYDKSEKMYRASETFEPAISSRQPADYLNQVRNVAAGALPIASSYLGSLPPCDIVEFPSRSIGPGILNQVLGAIRNHQDLEIEYQSMKQPAATRRWIAPHAIAFGGARWHARAWCHDSAHFRDFVLSRIHRVYRSRASDVDAGNDMRWSAFATVILRPRADLTAQQRTTVEQDFGMKDGELHHTIREALVYYFVRQLEVDRQQPSTGHQQPLEWVNAEELHPLMLEALHP
jgi:hypothetical protein